MPQSTLQQTFDLATQHHQAGRLAEAEKLYRQLLGRQPDNIDVLRNLGVLAHQAGRDDASAELLRRVIALKPDLPEVHNSLGIALRGMGQLDEAIAAHRRAIALRPGFFQAHNNLGIALAGKKRLDQAIAAFSNAIALQPDYAQAHNNLGNALKDHGRIDDSIAAYRAAIALSPNFAEGHANLGIALQEKGDLDAAIDAYRRSIALKPAHADAHYNLGGALRKQGRLDEAIAAHRQAVHFGPDDPESHYNLGYALLQRGDLPEGWKEFEWRWKVRDFPSPYRGFPEPLWDGRDLAGLTILLHAEQGFGDAIQFIRYLPMVASRGGRVIVEMPQPLIPLLRQLPGVEQWIPWGQPLPAFDVQSPLLTLPLLFGTTLKSIPAQSESLRADAALGEAWKHRLIQMPASCPSPLLRVGLVWAGSPKNLNDRNRSMSLSLFAPLATVAGIQFYSLQKGPAGAQAANPPEGMQLIDWTDELHDFAETAAMISHLDLIIAVDTAVAHLAGAMGKRVWVLLPFVPDWRWLESRQDSPWYPTMRLFRQTSAGKWDDVISQVIDALAAF